MSVIDTLKERGYLKQLSHEEEIKELLEKEKITFYIGFDPTADSLHVGHFIALMVMAHMQRAGHRPIILMGGGTGMIGDPSGKNEMRKMLTPEFIHTTMWNASRNRLAASSICRTARPLLPITRTGCWGSITSSSSAK